jgi:hypothetical protein
MLDTMWEDTKKYIGDFTCTMVENILFEPKVVGKHGRKDIGGVRKARNNFFEKIKRTKNDIRGAKNINVLVSEN